MGAFVPAGQKENHGLPLFGEIHSVAWATVDPHFRDAFTNWFHVSRKPKAQAEDPGLDFVLLAMFIWLLDHLGHQRYVRPLVIMGMNSIAVYMASELGDVLLGETGWHEAIYRTVFAPLASPANASLLYALTYVLIMYAIAYGMHRQKWFWRV